MVWSGALEANAGGEYLGITNIDAYMDILGYKILRQHKVNYSNQSTEYHLQLTMLPDDNH